MVNRLRGLMRGLVMIQEKKRGDEEGANVVHLVPKFLTSPSKIAKQVLITRFSNPWPEFGLKSTIDRRRGK
jgi:hypothetical protein